MTIFFNVGDGNGVGGDVIGVGCGGNGRWQYSQISNPKKTTQIDFQIDWV
ncbi:hypothetical protein [Flavobacterium sp.]|nr:hypothetical protein [Flavobacterium sp.]